EKGADITLQALEYGAIDFVAKPKLDLAGTLGNYAEEIVGKIKIAAKVKVGRLIVEGAGSETTPKLSADAVIKKSEGKVRLQTTEKIIAIGASTGGTEAIKEVLVRLPAAMPGIVITQHIPEAFSGPFAKRMNGASELTVCEAEDGQQILPGHVYISPGNRHLAISRSGARYICNLLDGPPVNRHKPSVDVMFRSVAQNVGVNAIGVILTGMGADGAQGMKELKESGAPTIAQDENSSVVWGMPGESVKLGCVDRVLDLYAIPKELIKMTK
ncbi:MAG: chemotaxis-specific protein-glutamate methyltransferase CheB, partial [Gammaproteobacteria bacterium]|nr:chemotaxis-specific protein-glutamate methyltransferase CheB [Gammaproteobacteria bacterium]